MEKLVFASDRMDEMVRALETLRADGKLTRGEAEATSNLLNRAWARFTTQLFQLDAE